MSRLHLMVAASLLGLAVLGCKEDQTTAPTQPPTTPPTPATTADAEDPDDHDHPDGNEHADRVELGTKTVGGLRLKATQDEPVKAGGESAFDLLVTGGDKPQAVRFWVGTADAEGSVKAKAEEESPDNWHTHVEVPDPLPPGSQFWAEIEPAAGEKFTVSFDLKK